MQRGSDTDVKISSDSHVIILSPSEECPSSQSTFTVVPFTTGNIASVIRRLPAGSSEHVS